MIGWEHEASSLSYWTRLEDQTLEKRRWTYAEKVPRKAENAGSGYVPVLDANGFSGGRFETRGLGRERKLVEALNDGSYVEYGHVRFALGDPRSSGTWRSPDGSVALLGTRYYDVPRYGLVRVTSRSEEHTSELQSLMRISSAVFCLKKQN